MLPVILLIFIIVPMIEIYFLIQVGSVIGSGWTILAVIATAVVGSWIIRAQGIKTFLNFQQSVAKGEAPAQSLFDGVCLLIAGVLLLVPGFFTDTIGFILLVPPFRVVLMKYFQARKKVGAYTSNVRYSSTNSYETNSASNNYDQFSKTRQNQDTQQNGSGRTIEVDDYHEVDKNQPKDSSSKNKPSNDNQSKDN